jgi:beta-lactamase class A
MRLSVTALLLVGTAAAQKPLQHQIRDIAANVPGKVSVACSLPGSKLNCDLNPRAHAPMQSVFKLPLAMTILHEIESGEFRLDQQIRFRPEDLSPTKTHSPLQDKYPQANVDLPLRMLLELTVVQSDNVAADILLRIAGGPKAIDRYIASQGIRGFHLQDDERALHRETKLQYRNWFQPRGAVQLLRSISDRSHLTAEHTELLLHWMESPTARLHADLPEGIRVFHKSGTSDVEHGLAAATNDIGLISLPNGGFLAIAVFVTDSTADQATREKVIARIARAAFDAATLTP